jgi:hypothetical protein
MPGGGVTNPPMPAGTGGASGGSAMMAGMAGAPGGAGVRTPDAGMPASGAGGRGTGGMGAMTGGTGGMGAMTGGTGGMGAAGMSGGQTGGPKPTKLNFSVTTKPQGGKFTPKNIGAIWIQDASGKWVYTLDWWSSLLNSQWQTKYNSVQGPSYTPFFGTKAPPDVMTSATLTMHKTHSVSWSLKDSNGAEAPDGDYTLVIELTEAEASGQVQEIPFTKGPAPVTMTPADTQYYTGMKLDLQ